MAALSSYTRLTNWCTRVCTHTHTHTHMPSLWLHSLLLNLAHWIPLIYLFLCQILSAYKLIKGTQYYHKTLLYLWSQAYTWHLLWLSREIRSTLATDSGWSDFRRWVHDDVKKENMTTWIVLPSSFTAYIALKFVSHYICPPLSVFLFPHYLESCRIPASRPGHQAVLVSCFNHGTHFK